MDAPRPHLSAEELGKSRERAYLHLGMISSLSNAVDLRMLQWGTWLTKSADPDSLRPAWAGLDAAVKRSRIKAALPEGWRHGHELIDAIRRCFAYRNSIVHAHVGFESGPGGLSPTWVWVNVNKRGELSQQPIEESELTLWEDRFGGVEKCLAWLVYPGTLVVNDGFLALEQLDLNKQLSIIGADYSVEPPAVPDPWEAAVQWIFPRAT